MDRVTRDLRAALQEESQVFLVVKKIVDELKARHSLVERADVSLLNKGLVNKCFSVYGCIPMSLSLDYIPIRYVISCYNL